MPFICMTCGTQHADSPGATPSPPDRCAICEDERQYVGWGGQRWTTLEHLRTDHRADIREEEAGLTGIGMTPSFGIGQRALLVQTPGGNVLWDCIALLDDEICTEVERRGGGGAGALLSGDTLQVVEDRRWVSFMRSYPNLIPLPAGAVQRIVAAVEPYDFQRVYGGWYGRVVDHDGTEAVRRSAERYLKALADGP